MYKVVLIDDESIIVEGLKKVVDWASYNCQVVTTCLDARSGAEALRQYRPDIVFTDIQMPGEDGLTMLAGLKSEFPDMQIAVLTGYRDFEYARRAIGLGVSRYLLKPSKMNEIEEALAHMTGILQTKGVGSAKDGEPAAEPVSASDNANSFLARQARAYICEHFMDKLTLQDVADHCYVSQWHLSKLLNKHLGMNFYEILNTVRIEKAKQMLEDPALRISEIASLAGYADTAHFSRVFKKSEGISANEYRNLHCGGGK